MSLLSFSPLHAAGFAAVSGSIGLAMLYSMVNPLTCALGALNLGLYTLAYTPLKRVSVSNTWLGSIVGAIPPMMGWAACTGHLEPGMSNSFIFLIHLKAKSNMPLMNECEIDVILSNIMLQQTSHIPILSRYKYKKLVCPLFCVLL